MSDEIQTDDNSLVKELRDTIKRISSERDELASFKRQQVVGSTFSEFGLDPSEGPGKFVAQAYDGSLEPDEVKSWLSEQGFQPQQEQAQQEAPSGLQQRVEQRQKMDKIANNSAPADGQKMTVSENRELFKRDPQAALKAFESGLVLPPGATA